MREQDEQGELNDSDVRVFELNEENSTGAKNIKMNTDGGCRQVVKASGCGSDIRGFEPHHPPHFLKSPHLEGFFVI